MKRKAALTNSSLSKAPPLSWHHWVPGLFLSLSFPTQGQSPSPLLTSLPRPCISPRTWHPSPLNCKEILASPSLPHPTQLHLQVQQIRGGLTDRIQALWEGSSGTTICAINLFFGVSFLTPRGRPTYFPQLNTVLSLRGIPRGDGCDSSLLLFYRRADMGPERVGSQQKWDQSQGLLPLHPALLLSKARAWVGQLWGRGVVGCSFAYGLCIRAGDAPCPHPGSFV